MQKKKILIVEDEPEISRTLKQKIEKNGFETYIASDGKEALARLEEKDIDLVLLDLLMPKMDGFEFLRAYKSDYPPVYILTNFSDEDGLQKAMDLGANKFLVKTDTSID